MKLEDLPSIDVYALPSVNFTERRRLPNKPGIYFAMIDSRCVYIGQSCRIKDRMSRHKIIATLSKSTTVQIGFLVCAESDRQLDRGFLDFTEQYFIQKIKPELNATAPCSPKGINRRYYDTLLGQEMRQEYSQIRKRNWYRKRTP